VKRLIVNADDLGRTHGVNRGVFDAHRRGIVTSATLMVNYPAASEVRGLSDASPRLGIGLHVQLTGGPPLLPSARIPSLVGADGRLAPKPDGLSGADPAEVEAEARAQLARFRELMGRDPTHFDSHHHSHRVAAVFAAVVALAKETGRPVRPADPAQVEILRREGIRTAERFSEEFFDETARLDVLLAIVRGLPEGTTELMCHPAVVDEELRSTSSYALPRARELEALTSPEALEAVRAAGALLVSYAAL
jgi:predicted glycoside hydrolase/deacetylase ChbG (UPF0249 family)